jgi:hypothetical protein
MAADFDDGKCDGMVASESDILTIGVESSHASAGFYRCLLAPIQPAILEVHSSLPTNSRYSTVLSLRMAMLHETGVIEAKKQQYQISSTCSAAALGSDDEGENRLNSSHLMVFLTVMYLAWGVIGATYVYKVHVETRQGPADRQLAPPPAPTTAAAAAAEDGLPRAAGYGEDLPRPPPVSTSELESALSGQAPSSSPSD